jgi:hypothetical protein
MLHQTLMMGTEMNPEMSVTCNQLMGLIVPENVINFFSLPNILSSGVKVDRFLLT